MLGKAASRSFLLLLLGAFTAPGLHAQTCGGTERWQVKVGTDSGAGSVQLQAVVPKTLQELINLQSPGLPDDNVTRLPDETHVFQLRGRLVKFKEEGNDNDYHLVISDDTKQFTAHDGSNIGHSLIAEIPDPNCIPGTAGDPNVASRFISQITCARSKMDLKFPDADTTGGWNPTGSVPVTITGIGFFDRKHGQIGRASNNLEIHPILDIDFGDGQPACFNPSGAAPEPEDGEPSMAIAAGAARVHGAAVPRGKWDYRSITASTADDLTAKARQLGARGWELVGATFNSRTGSFVGFLKRPARPAKK